MPSIRAFSFHSLLLLCGCAAAPALSVDTGELTSELEHELAARAEAVKAARRSDEPWELWAACLATSAPAVIAARHELAAAEAQARALGAPATMLEAESVGSGSTRDTEIALALDLPALVGGGRAGARRARAQVDALRAEAAFEATRFAALHELERALAELAVARGLAGEIAALEQSCAPSSTRLEILAERGWIAPDQVAAAHTMLHHLAALGLEQQAAAAAARAALARAAGLEPSAPWLDDEELSGLSAITQRAADVAQRVDPDTRALLETLPALRVARCDALAAEADVRIACAERWPALLIGPKATFTPDDLLLGGVLRLELPWPPAANAAVDAARSARDAAHDALASALASAENGVVERRAELRAAEEVLHAHGEGVAESSAQQLRAAEARFAVDAAALPEWTMALDQRTRALAARSTALGRWLAAAFDLSEALGPALEASANGMEDAR